MYAFELVKYVGLNLNWEISLKIDSLPIKLGRFKNFDLLWTEK